MGSAALTLCHVAMGAAEGYHCDNLLPWDVAAGVLIIREAGGVVIDTNGIAYMCIFLRLSFHIKSYNIKSSMRKYIISFLRLGGEFNVMSPKLIAVGNCELARELVKLIKHADLKTHQRNLLLQTIK